MLGVQLRVAERAAAQAAVFLRQHFNRLRRQQIHIKAHRELVTDLDRRANRLIVRSLLRAFPNYGVMAEEGDGRPTRSGYRWIVDPLDGTRNFVLHVPVYAVSIALAVNGAPVLGVVVLPDTSERFTAVVGQGARRNGRPIHVSATRTLRSAVCSLSGGQTRATSARAKRIEQQLDNATRSLRRTGSRVSNLVAVAAGWTDAALHAGPIHLWDAAAGVVIVREAGGEISELDGSRFTPASRTLLASNRVIHTALVRKLQ